MCKMSILTQYLRIFVPTRHGNAYMFWYTTALILLNFLFCIIEFFLIMMNCSPRARLWSREISGTCIGTTNIVFTAGFNIISDVMILVLPLTRMKIGRSHAYRSSSYRQELRSATFPRESREELNKDASRGSRHST